MDLSAELPRLLPLAIAWAESESKRALKIGVPLNAAGHELAKRVGVKRPDLVRLVAVEQIPIPQDGPLAHAASQVGLSGPAVSGLTLGYGIYLCHRDKRPQLLAHECRHVAQYESFGSIGAFLAAHLPQVAVLGHYDSPLEKDARAHEHLVED